jgi:hypothetical protein
MVRIIPWLLAVLLLPACGGEPPASPAAGDTVAPPAGEVPAPATPSTVVKSIAHPGTTAPAATPVLPPGARPPDGDRDFARLDGYGPLRFGMTLAQMREAWGATLNGAPPDGDADACFYLNVVGAGATPYLAFMLEGGRFVRYDVSNDALPAPGGGRRGMTEAELQALYRGALQAAPHEYVDGGKYLAFDTSGVAPSRLVFETDARGVATEWRVGLSPQADYVEGCS